MQIIRLDLPGLLLVKPKVFSDHRGSFSETFNARVFEESTGVSSAFVQDNESVSLEVNTIRGLHFQTPPHAQAKLVRVTRGRILDVVVDIRSGSPTYLKSMSVELSDDASDQLYVPKGFLHGFRTLEPHTRVNYKVDAYYNADCDRSVRFDDPALGCDWGLSGEEDVCLSDKDQNAPGFAEVDSRFTYEGDRQ